MKKLSEAEKKILVAVWSTDEGFELAANSEGQSTFFELRQSLAEALKIDQKTLGSHFYSLKKKGLIANEDVDEVVERYVHIDFEYLEEKIEEEYDEGLFYDISDSRLYRLTHAGFAEVAIHISDYFQLAKSDDLKQFFTTAKTVNPFGQDVGIFSREYAADYMSELEVLRFIDELNNRQNDQLINLNHDSEEYRAAKKLASQALEVIRQSNTLDEFEKQSLIGHIAPGVSLINSKKVYAAAITGLLLNPLYQAYSSALEDAAKPHIKAAIDAVIALTGLGS